jgi:hypothetical protein
MAMAAMKVVFAGGFLAMGFPKKCLLGVAVQFFRKILFLGGDVQS